VLALVQGGQFNEARGSRQSNLVVVGVPQLERCKKISIKIKILAGTYDRK